MARYFDDDIRQIKQTIDLKSLIERQGLTVTRQGKDYACHCPFHQDDTPSLIISPKSNLYHCFGCGAAGSVIDWVMNTQKVSFRHAMELLKNETPLTTVKPQVKRSSAPKMAAMVESDMDDQQLMRDTIDYYHQTLLNSPEALKYLEQRGLNSPELIKHFRLGYANRSLGYRLPSRDSQAGKTVRAQLQSIGLLRESGHEHFNGSIVVPVINQGEVLEVYGRKVIQKLRKGTPKHLYLPGPHLGVWNLEAFKSNNALILCESLFDAMTFWVHGYHNVTTSYGTEGFTDPLLAAFQQHDIERVYIAYDRDDAGNLAAEKVAEQLAKCGIEVMRLLFPQGMDANEMALESSDAKSAFARVIQQAEWMAGSRQLEDKTVVGSESVETDEAQPAKPAQPAPHKLIEAEVSDNEIKVSLGDRFYRVRGFKKNTSYEQMKINLLAMRGDNQHIDQFDLYSARHRAAFIKQASVELGLAADVLKKDLGQLLLKLEQLQDELIQRQTQPKDKSVALSDKERKEALTLLNDPSLLSRLIEDFALMGVVGENTNLLTGYLAAVSRKLDKPLAVIIQSTSAAGKSALMDAILDLIPEEERVQYSAMTGQSLFYMGETNLKHKILAIAEEEGAEQASYALKLLQSQGEVTMASTGKDADTGKLTTHEYRVEGPVMLFLTTTAIDIDEELLNRCLVLTVNESREQTQAIHAIQRQRQTIEGLLAEQDAKDIIRLHQNAQRLLRPLLIANPFANELTFLDDKTRTRRDHMKYLTLIRSMALLHQYQRPVKTAMRKSEPVEYIEVTLEDIALANRLAHEVLGRTLDELPPQTRTLLKHIQQMVKAQSEQLRIAVSDIRFTRRDVRQYSQFGNTQLKIHMQRLEELEYLLVHKGGRGQSLVYELLYTGDDDGERHMVGLIGLGQLSKQPIKTVLDANRSGVNDNLSGSSRPQVGAKSGGCRIAESVEASGVDDKSEGNGQKGIYSHKINGSHTVVSPKIVGNLHA
jgi:DNA primase catalytic core